MEASKVEAVEDRLGSTRLLIKHHSKKSHLPDEEEHHEREEVAVGVDEDEGQVGKG